MFLLKIAVIFCVIVLFFVQSTVFSQNFGKIEWHSGGPVITAMGLVAINPTMPLAVQRRAVIESAKIESLRNVLQVIKRVNINSKSTVESEMLARNITATSLEGMITQFEVDTPIYHPDGTVGIKVEVSIYKNQKLMRNLLPIEKIGSKSVNAVKSSKTPEIYTGLIINAKGAVLSPALMVRIKDQRGNLVYTPEIIRVDYLFNMGGMVSYVANMRQAKEMTHRIGRRPLIVTAVSSSGKNKTDLIISNEDAEKIFSAKENIDWLKECRVVVIVNNI